MPGVILVSSCMQSNAQNSTRDECAHLHAKIEMLEQRQTAATQLATEAAHTQSVQSKQMDRCAEEHQQRLMTCVNKAESRGREAAEHTVQRAIADCKTSMQVIANAALEIVLLKRISVSLHEQHPVVLRLLPLVLAIPLACLILSTLQVAKLHQGCRSHVSAWQETWWMTWFLPSLNALWPSACGKA